jgi:hypothetical protein
VIQKHYCWPKKHEQMLVCGVSFFQSALCQFSGCYVKLYCSDEQQKLMHTVSFFLNLSILMVINGRYYVTAILAVAFL